MQEIANECKEDDVTFCEHATSHMRILACNICNIRLTKANAVLHLGCRAPKFLVDPLRGPSMAMRKELELGARSRLLALEGG